MAYIPTRWVDRVRTLTDRFYITKNDDDTYTLTPAGTLMVAGTPQDQANFNNMEEGINEAHVAVELVLNALRQMSWDSEEQFADFLDSISDLGNADTTLGGRIDTLAENTGLTALDITNALSMALILARQDKWDIDDIKAWITEHQTVQTGTVTLTNTLAFPFNDSKETVTLNPVRENTKYIVLTDVTSFSGNAGDIVVSDKAVNGFAIAFTGSASSVTVSYSVIGGYEE